MTVFAAPAEKAPDNIEALKQEIARTLKENRMPGAGLVLVSNGQVEWEGGLGMASPEDRRAADADTLFRIGSISKGFVTLAALKLQEEGKLNLNDTFHQWAPEIALDNRWEKTDPVRLAHLLEHTAGLNDLTMGEMASSEASPVPLKAALDRYPAARVARWRPGSRFAYSNMGPALVAYVVEKASGRRFEDYVQEHFFNPLNMKTATYFHPDESRFAGQYGGPMQMRRPYWHFLFRPSGTINASPRDMAGYLQFLLARGRAGDTPLLQASSIERMERCETLPMCRRGAVGYGLASHSTMHAGFRFRGHDGAVMGARAFMGYLPEHQAGYIVLLNSDNYAGADRIRKLVSGYLVRRLQPAAPPPGIVPARDDIARHTGFYRVVSPRYESTHGVDYLLNILHVKMHDKGASTRFVLSSEITEWAVLHDGVLRKAGEPAPTAAVFTDGDGRTVIQSTMGTWEKVSAVSALGPPALAALCLALIASAPVFALVWGGRRLAGRLGAAGPLRVRVLPLLAALAFAASIGIVMLIGRLDNPLEAVGTPSPTSVGLWLCGLAFAALSAAAVFVVWRERKAPMHRAAWWHSALVTLACATTAGYLLSWGLIGVPTWGM